MSNIQSKVLNIAFHFKKNRMQRMPSYNLSNRKLQRENDEIQMFLLSRFNVDKLIFINHFPSYVPNSFVCGRKKDVRQKIIFFNNKYSIFSTRLCKNPRFSKFKNIVRMIKKLK